MMTYVTCTYRILNNLKTGRKYDLRKIEDKFLIENFYNELDMQKLFNKDMKRYMKLLKFEMHEYLCREDEELEYFMFLVQGKAKVFKSLPNGRSSLLSFYNSFRAIGDIEFIKEEVVSGTLQALSTCYCLAIPMDITRNQLIEDSKFLKFACESLAEKLAAISMNSSINLLYPLENRLASYINEILLLNKNGNIYVDFDESLVNIAEHLGSSYRHLLRTLNVLCEKDVLQKDSKGYRVTNKNKLVELAGDLYKDVKFI